MRLRTFVPAAMAALLAAGCGGTPLYTVTGEITWQGQPVDDGQINFLPEDGTIHPVTAKIVNGRYEAKVPAGRMKVEVHGQKDMGYNEAMHQHTKKSYIPSEYNAYTILTCDVETHDHNVADFHLPLKK